MTKYTIPPSTNFDGDVTALGFFQWLKDSGVNLAAIDGTKPVTVDNDTHGWSVTATTNDGQTGTWPLQAATGEVAGWVMERFGPKAVALDPVASKVARLKECRQQAASLSNEAEELRAEILGIIAATAGTDRPAFGTLNGVPVLDRKVIGKTRLIRKALEAEYPAIAARFITSYDEIRLEFR